MALHFPTHRADYPTHQVLRDTLLVVGALIIAMLLVFAATLIVPAPTSTSTGVSEAQRMSEFRAGERALWTLPFPSESQLLNEFRAGERALWTLPGP